MGIKAVYVFDGVPPTLKEVEIKRRARVKEEALVKYERALQEGKMEEARMYAQMTSRLKDYMADDAKHLLKLLGVPWIQAPSEGEAQAAHMTIKGDTDYCASQDYDSLLFGAPRLIRNVTISGRRKLPRKNLYVEVAPEIIELGKVLNDLGITREQLVDVGILVGTDFNPEGVKGVGPKTALQLIREHGAIEKALPALKEASFPAEPERIREVFLHPKVRDDYPLVWREPDVDGVVEFMCGEKDFDEERVRKALEKMAAGIRKGKGATTLEQWFGKA
jgi:flap endonuclease-1